MGAVSAALFGDYTRSFWLVLAIAVIGIAFAGIGYCLWCCTHAPAMCCSPCLCCARRARARDEANQTSLGIPEEAPPLRGPHGLRPTDNDLYASIKNVDRKRGGRPHVLIAAGSHTARLAQPEGGATPRANAHGVVLEVTDVISASSDEPEPNLRRPAPLAFIYAESIRAEPKSTSHCTQPLTPLSTGITRSTSEGSPTPQPAGADCRSQAR